MQRTKFSKKAWTIESDKLLVELISDIGPRLWDTIAKSIPDRSGKQCRERWSNQLNPLLNKLEWSVEENWILFNMQRSMQSRWSELTSTILGRTDNNIKNYWNCIFRHKKDEMNDKLEDYIAKCLALDRPADPAAAREDII